MRFIKTVQLGGAMGTLSKYQSLRVLSRVFGVAVTVLVGAGVGHAASAYIRVNQVGYATGATKRAYLMATATETGATFAVKNSGGSTTTRLRSARISESGERSPSFMRWISTWSQPQAPTPSP